MSCIWRNVGSFALCCGSAVTDGWPWARMILPVCPKSGQWGTPGIAIWLSCKCRRHVSDMSATCDTVAGFCRHGAVTATQNQLTVPTSYVGISMYVGRYTFSDDIFAKCVDMSVATFDISGVNLPLPADMTQLTFAAKHMHNHLCKPSAPATQHLNNCTYAPPLCLCTFFEPALHSSIITTCTVV